MDESNETLATCFSLANLMRAATLSARGVSWKSQVQRFMADRLCQCVRLRDEILSGTWRPREVRPFTVCERGKLRRVTPVSMRDRVVERCLCDNAFAAFVTSEVMEGSSACLKGRGLHYAVNRIKGHLERADFDAWYYRYDFHDYFHKIDRGRAIDRMRGRLAPPFIPIVALSIGGESGVGLELGSQVCQLTAVWYPTPLDHVILGLPGLIGYDRYMDDGLAVFDSKEQALEAQEAFAEQAGEIGLTMNPDKTYCNRVTHPIVFCKTRIRKRPDGVSVNVRKPQTRHSVRHVRHVMRRAERVEIDTEPVIASTLGYINRGDADLSRLMAEFI